MNSASYLVAFVLRQILLASMRLHIWLLRSWCFVLRLRTRYLRLRLLWEKARCAEAQERLARLKAAR